MMDKRKTRILLVDDNISIHDDFKQVLRQENTLIDSEQLKLEKELFSENNNGNTTKEKVTIHYAIDDAFQGEEAIAMVDNAVSQGDPYALIFMDVRMPPGIDGIQTVQRIWEKNPNVEVAICTAHSDYSWDDILRTFGSTDHLLFIQKPFNSVTVRQIALTMTTKWELDRQNREHIANLEQRIAERTHDLEIMIREKQGYIERIAEEMNRAEIVQKQLLPVMLPKMESIDVASCYIPATGIGGDLYDVIPVNDTTMAFLIFDVAGHGIAAALVAAIGKSSFNQHIKSGYTPEKILELVNKDIYISTAPEMYISAFLVIWNKQTGLARFSGAGYPPQFHFIAESSDVEEMTGIGMFLGVNTNSVYTGNEVRIKKKDRLILYTDGLTETFNEDDELYGRQRVKEVIKANGNCSSSRMIKYLKDDNDAFRGSCERTDDLCILAIRFKNC